MQHLHDNDIVEYEERYVNHERSLVLDNARCIDCGFCEIVCPREAIKKIPEINEMSRLKYAVDQNKCIYCGICQIFCPVDALTLNVDEEPRLIIVETGMMPEIDPVTVDIDGNSIKKFLEGSISIKAGNNVSGEDLEGLAGSCPTHAITALQNGIAINSTNCIFCTRCARYISENNLPVTVTVKRSSLYKKGTEISPLWNDASQRLLGQDGKIEAIRGDLSFNIAERVVELGKSLGRDLFLEEEEEDE